MIFSRFRVNRCEFSILLFRPRRPMIGIRRQGLYKLDVAAKLVRHDDARLAKLPLTSPEKKRLAALVLRRR